LPVDPLEIQFETEDGQIVNGRYYPAAAIPAPLVVMMHWAPGDQNEWSAIAAWLQNRGLAEGKSGGQPWLDSSWFPPMLEGQSFAVFTFTFRKCEGGCKSFFRAAWLMDARAAMIKARELEGVDPNRIVAIGASIGADGAPDGCSWVNAQFPNTCLGALSLSPGGYLTVPYQEVVNALAAEQPPKPAWCLYADGDGESKPACENASGDNYKSVIYAGSNHGMELIEPELDPNVLQIILDFLKSVFAI
jgi:dienelactone hydrolase